LLIITNCKSTKFKFSWMFSNFEQKKSCFYLFFSSFGEQDKTFNTISFMNFEDQLAITCHQFTISNSLRLFRQHDSIWKQLMKTKDKTCCNSKAIGIHFAHNIRIRYSNFIFEIQSSFSAAQNGQLCLDT
jgi:hypothetical protein